MKIRATLKTTKPSRRGRARARATGSRTDIRDKTKGPAIIAPGAAAETDVECAIKTRKRTSNPPAIRVTHESSKPSGHSEGEFIDVASKILRITALYQGSVLEGEREPHSVQAKALGQGDLPPWTRGEEDVAQRGVAVGYRHSGSDRRVHPHGRRSKLPEV